MADSVSITRVGTQVVVRLAGPIDDSQALRLTGALSEVDALVLRSVLVDCSDCDSVTGAGVAFVAEAGRRWRLRLMNPPPGLRQALTAAMV